VPSWRRHILRKSLMLEDYKQKRISAELDKGGGYAYASVPSSPRNIAVYTPSPYAPLPREDPDDRRSPPKLNGVNGAKQPEKPALTADEAACLGMARAINILGGVEHAGACSVEKASVYGAAVAIPQIARSGGWPKSMCGLAFRAYLFVILNYFVQTLFVYYIYDSQTNMNPYGGQMHLCDFASHISNCPHAPNCLGPGGEPIPDPGTLYPFDIWNTRKFVRDAMIQIFPDKGDQFGTLMDPGEYGIESNYCRLLCIFVFVLQIVDEFTNIIDFARLLRKMPTSEAAWIEYELPADDVGPDPHGDKHLECVRFVVSAMPMRWKLFNVFFILLPRIFIWRMLTMAGVHFLMETAAMVDQIVNTTALSFVLTTDELILERLATKATRFIVSGVQDYQLFDNDTFSNTNDQETLNRYYVQELSWCHGAARFSCLPWRLFWVFGLMSVFTAEYYWHNCTQTENGSIVSIDVFLPLAAHLEFGSFFKHFFSISENPHVDNSFWTMPSMA